VRFRFIAAQAQEYPVRTLCRVLAVSPSGYYAWRRRTPSRREQANAELLQRIREVHRANRSTYGSPRIWFDLRQLGSRNRIARLMRQHGIRPVRRPRHIVTTVSGGNWRAEPNLLMRRFAPGEVRAWLADLTYVRTDEGVLYLTVVLNLESRRVLGWSMGDTPAGQLALDVLRMAADRAGPEPGLLHHSDRGGHYASAAYRALLQRYGMEQSMSRTGDCWDNAVVESFFATLKREALYPQQLRTRQQARAVIFNYIEVFYNRQRRHSALGYISPEEYEKLHCDP
jgi:transposase InsO family protein